MIRTVLIAHENVLSFHIPDKYIGKKIEVIAFAIEEAIENLVLNKPAKKKTFSSVQLDTRGFKFNREGANER